MQRPRERLICKEEKEQQEKTKAEAEAEVSYPLYFSLIVLFEKKKKSTLLFVTFFSHSL